MPTITATPVSLESAVRAAGVNGTIAIAGLESTAFVVDAYGATAAVISSDGTMTNAHYANNTRPEWHVLTSTATPPETMERDAAIAAAGIGGVVQRFGLHYLVSDGTAGPALAVISSANGVDSDPTTATFYVSGDGWVAWPARVPAIADGTTVTFHPPTSGERTHGVVISSSPNVYRHGAGVIAHQYMITVPEGDGMAAIVISRGDAEDETVVPSDTVTEPAGTDIRSAMSLAGVGGVVQYRDSSDSGRYRVTAHDTLIHLVGGIERGTNLPSELSQLSDVWTVVTPGESTPVVLPGITDAPAAPTPVIPRTADEAHRMLSIVKPLAELSLDPNVNDLLTSLRVLRLFLPGGKAEVAGKENSVAQNLCGQYDRIVSPVLGWAVRDSLRGDRGYDQHDEFLAVIERHETRHAGESVADILATFAARYERGGPVNEALTDHIRDHLEREKVEAAGEFMESLGFDAPECPDRDFIVYVDVTRTVTVTQRVAVGVTAEDESDAGEMVDSSDVYNAIDDSEWYVSESGDNVSLSTSRYDIDDWNVDYAEEN